MGPSGPFPRSKCNFHEGRPRRRVSALVLFVRYDSSMRAAAVAFVIALASCNTAKEPTHVYLAKAIEPSSPTKEIATGREVPRSLLEPTVFWRLTGTCMPFARLDDDPRGEPGVHCSKTRIFNEPAFLCVDPKHPPLPGLGGGASY